LVRQVAAPCLAGDATCSNEAAKCLHVRWTVSACGTCAACDIGRLTATSVEVQNISVLTSLTSPAVLACSLVLFVDVSSNQINKPNQFSKVTHMSNFLFMKLISFPSAFIALLCSMCSFFNSFSF